MHMEQNRHHAHAIYILFHCDAHSIHSIKIKERKKKKNEEDKNEVQIKGKIRKKKKKVIAKKNIKHVRKRRKLRINFTAVFCFVHTTHI